MKLLELRFKLLNLGEELNPALMFPLNELKDKSRTSSRGKPDKLPSEPAKWLLLRLSDRNPSFMEQEEVKKDWSTKLLNGFLERSRNCNVSRAHMEAKMEELDMS